MSSIVVAGDTSGSVTLQAPAVAGSNILSLPAVTATVITDSAGILNIGSGQVYKDAAGNVGIGTSSPTGKLDVAGTIKTLGYTVATLPTGVVGARAYVTNALAPTFGAIVVTGGAVTIPVFYNGTNWIVG